MLHVSNMCMQCKGGKEAKFWIGYSQLPHLTLDTIWESYKYIKNKIQVHYKSYFTTQYFKSFFTFLLYINGLCFTMHVIKFSCHFVSINHINV